MDPMFFDLKRDCDDGTIRVYYNGENLGLFPQACDNLPEHIRIHEATSAFKNYVAFNSPKAIPWQQNSTFRFYLKEMASLVIFGRVKSVTAGNQRLVISLECAFYVPRPDPQHPEKFAMNAAPQMECSFMLDDLNTWGVLGRDLSVEEYKTRFFQIFADKWVCIEAYTNTGYNRSFTNMLSINYQLKH